MDEAHRCLRDYWGHDSFRGIQAEVIRHLVWDGQSTAVLMPTGGGKSLLYQVPAVLLPGLTIVVSPLLALMKDQVDALRLRNYPAAALNSTLTTQEAAAIKEDVRNGNIKLLYVAPERLNNELFLNMVMNLECISMVAVDEAHCIAEWGPSFRPDYLKVARFAQEIGAQRVLALTATATPAVAQAICEGFSIDPTTSLFKVSTYRSNLTLRVVPAETPEAKLSVLIPMLNSQTGATIIYVTTHADAEDLVKVLNRQGFPEARMYHAGLNSEDRIRVQEEFIKSERGIVCSTIAFGMGIDKASIRQIIHYKLPKTLENYSQEIGRAGRDGLPSQCCVFLSSQDLPLLEGFARGNTPSLRSIKTWLADVFITQIDEDGCFVFNHYDQAKENDIKTNTLGLLFAQLELRFNLLRATTPYYSSFQWPANPVILTKMKAEKWKESRALCSHMTVGPTWHTVDVCHTAAMSGLKRTDLTSQINKWEKDYGIQPKGSKVRARYRPLREDGSLPPLEAVDEIAGLLYDSMILREEADVQRLYQVVDILTKDDCIAQSLGEYFGDDDSVPLGACGACTHCATLEAVPFQRVVKTKVDDAKAKLILDKCPYRDDARLLARIAFGIASPRTTELKLTQASEGGPFGCMESTDFNKLVDYFEVICKKADYINQPIIKPTSRSYASSSQSPAKRKNTSSQSGSGSRANKKVAGSSGTSKYL
ncbi:hypothetical protein CROQUDRAFT_35761 [Cronartium quercuum f. sp. fusiforme G11]|uniref:DNA 3'-5' helicase n=1 Tax=Cronartium quercuum f. sp. fusiforme G11 TaxID=708437 RepID=A0A9P6NZH0_9BASI|nr:hypothetical protein CROQUDRAFT_35761 [Cronartium quercuum f. sp. fusiforme G11]